MPKLPLISGKEAVRDLERAGFMLLRQKGSHVILKKMTIDGEIGTVVPLHQELAVGTLGGILKQAHLTVDEFFKYL